MKGSRHKGFTWNDYLYMILLEEANPSRERKQRDGCPGLGGAEMRANVIVLQFIAGGMGMF